MPIYQKSNSNKPYNVNAFFYRGQDWLPHFHSDFETVRVYEGELEVTIDGKIGTMRAGDWAILLPNRIHSYRSTPGTTYWCCVFSPDYVQNFALKTRGKKAKNPIFRIDRDLDRYLCRELAGKFPESVEKLSPLFGILCYECAKNTEFEDARSREGDAFFEMLDYVLKNHGENATLDEMAEHLGYEKHYASRLFHRLFSSNFKHFLNLYRVNDAIEYLKDPDLSVTEVAFKSGFSSVRSFNRAFFESVGMQPLQFRKEGKDAFRAPNLTDPADLERLSKAAESDPEK